MDPDMAQLEKLIDKAQGLADTANATRNGRREHLERIAADVFVALCYSAKDGMHKPGKTVIMESMEEILGAARGAE